VRAAALKPCGATRYCESASTQLDVRFEAVGDQTRVTVEHRGWDQIPQDHVARHDLS